MACTTTNNLGSYGCANLTKVGRRLIIVPELDQTGTKNEFANVAAVTKSALQTKFDDSNSLDRFYTLPLMENVSDLRAETVFQTWNSGRRSRVRDGVRTFTAVIPDEYPQLLDNILSFQGTSFGVYIIDADGNFIYQTDSATKLKVQPFLIVSDSFDAKYVKATDSEKNQIMITFDFKDSVKDELLRWIAYGSLNFDALSSDLYSLLDVTSATSSLSTTAATFTETLTDYGAAVGGLLTGDLVLYNVNTSLTVANATFAETGQNTGIYNVTFAAAISGHVIRYTWTKARYSFTVGTFTIP